MDTNLEIINTVFSSIHSGNSLRSIASLYSPSFTFESPIRGAINFEEHCTHLSSISNNCQIEVNSMVDAGCCYEIEMDLVIIDSAEKEFSRIPATANVFFENNLITKITSNYVADSHQIEYIKKYMTMLLLTNK